ncbi:MAG TPA: class I SAM-dependent methyltransferase [Verrucomicrobiae bacterium]|nr:class I SAM-dependent methyltransferase [Verrucomicrobiae bacterium]
MPGDLDRFYPAHYYSFKPGPGKTRGWRAWRHARRDFTMLTGRGWIGRWIASKRAPTPEVEALRRAGLAPESRVLDVGCGGGQLLAQLWRAGLRNLTGIDPYLPLDVEAAPGVLVRSTSLENVQESFDIIMLHHVIEHLPDPRATLGLCRQKLRPGGRVLLRMPCVDCLAWEQYGVNWIGCDAPRHLHVFSRRSFDLLAEQSKFKIVDWWCDSGGTQFWSSELMSRGLTLYDANGVGLSPEAFFSEAQLAEFNRKAAELNRQGRGDAVGVVAVPV